MNIYYKRWRMEDGKWKMEDLKLEGFKFITKGGL